MERTDLSKEQRQFIDYGVAGHNILVDACIGSGKTTAIQVLCDNLVGKRILYLTYNKLLKLDAKARITNHYVTVTNYHGFAYMELARANVRAGLGELVQTYNRVKPRSGPYDVLILDEYQDIEQETADMLAHIKACNPTMQIIAVGDMDQKIYDKTNLKVQPFISELLGNFIPMEFTNCFRLGKDHAEMLGRVWGKKITGVNPDFELSVLHEYQVRDIVSNLKPSELLVVGSLYGNAVKLQNYLETEHDDVFNKRTLWSKIKETDGGATNPDSNCAIFTTYDGCKGMERDVVVVYDWSVNYWESRLNKPDTDCQILTNIFCVAASRAKKHLILVRNDSMLEEDDLINPSISRTNYRDMPVSEMFDFKFIEDVEDAYHALDVREIQPSGDPINVPIKDELIDLSMAIGHFQEVYYFNNYDIDHDIEYSLGQPNKSHLRKKYQNYTLDQKLLYLSTLETGQFRYMNQVRELPISEDNRARIKERLATHLPADAKVQVDCYIPFFFGERLLFNAHGICDVIHDNRIYELKFVSELSHTHVLQLAMYLVCLGYQTGRLWNVRTNQMLEVTIPDRADFLDKVTYAVTKERYKRFSAPSSVLCDIFYSKHKEECQKFLEIRKNDPEKAAGYFRECGLTPPVNEAQLVLRLDKKSDFTASSVSNYIAALNEELDEDY